MCEWCDDPMLTPERFLERLSTTVAACGWVVQGVERERDRPPWAYTVGLTEHGRPELLVTGLPLPRAGALLNDLAEHALQTDPHDHGDQEWLPGGVVVEYVYVPHPEVHLLHAVALYGPAVTALQVVWTDDRGRWPWAAGFRGRRGGQPVLGPRAVKG